MTLDVTGMVTAEPRAEAAAPAAPSLVVEPLLEIKAAAARGLTGRPGGRRLRAPPAVELHPRPLLSLSGDTHALMTSLIMHLA